jgi:hypothetical protein
VVIVKVSQKGQPIRQWNRNWKVSGDQNPAEIADLYEQELTEIMSVVMEELEATVRPVGELPSILITNTRNRR